MNRTCTSNQTEQVKYLYTKWGKKMTGPFSQSGVQNDKKTELNLVRIVLFSWLFCKTSNGMQDDTIANSNDVPDMFL